MCFHQVALKYVLKDEEEMHPRKKLSKPKEVGLFEMVNKLSGHPNILKLYNWFDRPASYVMAMERPNPCKDLFTYRQDQGGVLDEDEARNVTSQLLGALQHCEDQGVVHRDVKPENILIQTDTKEIKLIDFGCGDPLKNTAYTDFSGTPEYLPIEWFQKEKFLAGPGTVWSVGVTLYNLVCGGDPFTSYTSKGMRHVEISAGLSPEIKDFICCCLRPQARDRPTLEQLQLHPWILKHF
ncbi:serine/threonine-protein kinase pim-3-like isoform X1 [Conger conger]|nr:serine/threonine-protein kinase pim-3-like isoform X1 [Conger conger]XP_061075221.1 serine/threonine-protein kinase pim-3-like isoform X1 [Conger conger]